ncbi:pyrroline-5-carboxylate reductase [Desulfovibrio cuneatus]|uniref:pyrroline-5-carboxylate reductase n=1 Tax=Desulfovibrio cuneatus TaxID=159728 RepID=UPI0003F900B6|nr:pyrroline-5-carboxylate reductase [Desulfovibrio cuneatus]
MTTTTEVTNTANAALPLGLIGCGNMGSALARGILNNATLSKHFPLLVYDRNPEKMAALQELGAAPCFSMQEVAEKSQYMILAVKPAQMFGVLQTIKAYVTMEHVAISLAVGVTIAALDRGVERACAVVRLMPNTLVAAGHGHFGLCLDDPDLQDKQKKIVRYLFAYLGEVVELPENKMNAYGALAGCGPAYMYYMAEGLVDAGVNMGLSRAAARGIVLSLMEGSALLAKQTGQHISILREEVTSPGGTTIAATTSFDTAGVRGQLIQGVLAAFEKGKEFEQN